MKTLLIASALAVSLLGAAAQEYVTQRASGSTSASVLFEGRDNPLRLTGIDVTSDKAGSLLTYYYGASNVTVMRPASTAVSNVLVTGPIASNTIVLVQTTNGTVFNRTIGGITQTPVTNQIITVNNALGTNCAVGDALYQRLASFATQLTPSTTNSTRFYLTSTNGITQGDRVSTHTVSGRYTAVVTNANQVTNFIVPTFGLVSDVAPGDLVYALVTNTVLAAGATAAGSTNFYVTTTNGWAVNTLVLIRNAEGRAAVRTIIGYAAGTNLLVSQPVVPFALTNDDSFTRLSATYTNMFPVAAGAGALQLNSTNNLSPGTNLVIAATNVEPFLGRMLGTATATTMATMNIMSSLPVPLTPGTTWHKLTNAWYLAVAATNTDFSLTVSNSTPPAPGTALILTPATGGAFPFSVWTTNPVIMQSLRFTAAHSVQLNPGDVVWSVSSNTTPVGAATLRLSGESLFAVPAKRPLQVSLDGTSAVSLNSINARYE